MGCVTQDVLLGPKTKWEHSLVSATKISHRGK